MTVVGETADLSMKRTGRIEQPFKLDAGDNIGMLAVTVLLQGLIRHLAEAGRHDDRPDMESTFHRLLVEINGEAAAYRHTYFTCSMLQMQAGTGINIIGGWHGLGIIDMNGTGYRQTFIIGIHLSLIHI